MGWDSAVNVGAPDLQRVRRSRMAVDAQPRRSRACRSCSGDRCSAARSRCSFGPSLGRFSQPLLNRRAAQVGERSLTKPLMPSADATGARMPAARLQGDLRFAPRPVGMAHAPSLDHHPPHLGEADRIAPATLGAGHRFASTSARVHGCSNAHAFFRIRRVRPAPPICKPKWPVRRLTRNGNRPTVTSSVR